MKSILIYLVICLTSLFQASQASAEPSNTIRIAYQTGDINTLLMYAYDVGLFKKNHVNVELVPFAAGPAELPAFAGDSIDMGWMGSVPAVAGYANGLPLTIILFERVHSTDLRLDVNPKSDIIKLADLKGKRIAITLGSTSHYELLRAISEAGLTPNDLTIVNLSPVNMPPAYRAGEIDGALTWEPSIGQIEKEGAKVLATTKSLGMISTGVLVARQPFVSTHLTAIKNFLKAWQEALQDYQKDPTAVSRFEAKRIHLSPKEFSDLINRMGVYHPTFKQQLTSDYMGVPNDVNDSRLMKHLQSIGNFLLTQKRINKLPANWAPLIDTVPLESVVKNKNN